MYQSHDIEAEEGLLHVVGNQERMSVVQTRRSWNIRVGEKDVDKLNVLRVGIPQPNCFLYDNMMDWIEMFQMITQIEEVSWCGQQLLNEDGSKFSLEDKIDRETCFKLVFRIEYSCDRTVAFAGADLHQFSKRLGIVVSLPNATVAVQQMRLGNMIEVFEKCLLESIDRDVMERFHSSAKLGSDQKERDDEWEPEDEVELGIALYVDNVGKSSGMTPVLSLSFIVILFLRRYPLLLLSVFVSDLWSTTIHAERQVTLETDLCVHRKGEQMARSR